MFMESDKDILYAGIMKLRSCFKLKKAVEEKKDAKMIRGIASRSDFVLWKLTDKDILPVSVQKYVMAAKGMYLQYSVVKARNPVCIDPILDGLMDRMIREACRWEAEMIQDLRLHERGKKRIDLNTVFMDEKNIKKLGSGLARDIVLEAINEPDYNVSAVSEYYVTKFGKKIHKAGCRYCDGRSVVQASYEMIRNKKLSPCQCMKSLGFKTGDELTCVTAFVDEAIRPVLWDEDGVEGKVGSYSYIICRGNLAGEFQISEDNIITEGVDFTGENKRIERITETAIGKVLLTLAYDCEFYGQVHIFTDNIAVTKQWETSGLNSKLVKQFFSVEVSYVPREENTRADKLGRTRTLLDIPAGVYKEIKRNCHRVKELEKQIQKLENKRCKSA